MFVGRIQSLLVVLLLMMALLAQVSQTPFLDRGLNLFEQYSLFNSLMVFYLAQFLFVDQNQAGSSVTEESSSSLTQGVSVMIVLLLVIYTVFSVMLFLGKATPHFMQKFMQKFGHKFANKNANGDKTIAEDDDDKDSADDDGDDEEKMKGIEVKEEKGGQSRSPSEHLRQPTTDNDWGRVSFKDEVKLNSSSSPPPSAAATGKNEPPQRQAPTRPVLAMQAGAQGVEMQSMSNDD